jgi:hypothetical protein
LATVEANVAVGNPVMPVTVIEQPLAAASAAVTVKLPVADVAGATVTCEQLEEALKPLVPFPACVAVKVAVRVGAGKPSGAGAAVAVLVAPNDEV